MLEFKQGSAGASGGYLQKDLLIQCMALKSYSFGEAVGNILAAGCGRTLQRRSQQAREMLILGDAASLGIACAPPGSSRSCSFQAALQRSRPSFKEPSTAA